MTPLFFSAIEHPLHALVSAGQTVYMDCGDLYIQVQSAVFGGLQSTGVCTALQYPDQECPESVDAENQLLPLCEGKHYCSVSVNSVDICNTARACECSWLKYCHVGLSCGVVLWGCHVGSSLSGVIQIWPSVAP